MTKRFSRLPALLTAGLLCSLLLLPQAAKSAARDAMALCAGVLIPSLFPFCVGMELFVALGLPEQLGRRLRAPMQRLFGLPGEAAVPLLTGLLGGYPLGAKLTAELYRRRAFSRREAIRLSCFSNNAGPAFILGALGGAVFGSARLGLLLYFLQVLSALGVGLFLRAPREGGGSASSRPPGVTPRVLPEAIAAAAGTMLYVCATVVFSSVVLGVLCALLPLERLPREGVALFRGFLELTNGCMALQALPLRRALPAASFLLGWGGLCVHLQALSALTRARLPVWPYLRAKLMQALLAFLLTELCVVIFF